MSIGSVTSVEPREQVPPVRWCAGCHELQAHGSACKRCGPDEGLLIPLARGLASVEVAGERGLIRYQGDRITTLVGVALVLMLPASAAVALAGDTSALSPMLLGLCFVGVPVLALVDAHRAGVAALLRAAEIPATMAPELPGWLLDAPSGGDRAVLRGVVARVERVVRAPVSEQGALVYRVDIRAGRHAELVARRTESAEFLVTCGDGTQVLITGVLELVASGYRAVSSSGAVELEINGTRLLPAGFNQGGWACELFVGEGETVEIDAPAGQEERAHPLGAGYRNAGIIAVLRGTPGRPIVIRPGCEPREQRSAPDQVPN